VKFEPKSTPATCPQVKWWKFYCGWWNKDVIPSPHFPAYGDWKREVTVFLVPLIPDYRISVQCKYSRSMQLFYLTQCLLVRWELRPVMQYNNNGDLCPLLQNIMGRYSMLECASQEDHGLLSLSTSLLLQQMSFWDNQASVLQLQ
jgi:hypothetical protein